MSDENDDVPLLEYMYVIGFTENQYYPAARKSPTPGEQKFSTQASGYAQRCNKGAEKILSGASEMLERRRRKSVTKIHTDILDLMYELSERRKSTSPGPKLRYDLYPTDSRLSMFSPVMSGDNSRSSSSNSQPIIEVQQLPPLSQANFTLPAINPEAHRDQYRSTLKRNKYPRLTLPNVNKEKVKNGKRTETRVKRYRNENTEPNIDKSQDTESIENKGKILKNTSDVTKSNTNKQEGKVKPKPILKRRNAGLRLVDHLDTIYGKYSHRFPLREKTKTHLSFCQCSYDERAEKERMDNVMRRYSSKTNAGPLDFTKLQRQIERSKTMVW